MQGQQFTLAGTLSGRDVSTLPDFPAEIRALPGSCFGVSAFQIQFGTEQIFTPGENPDALIMFNPAALVVNLPALRPRALIILDEDSFTARNLRRARKQPFDGWFSAGLCHPRDPCLAADHCRCASPWPDYSDDHPPHRRRILSTSVRFGLTSVHAMHLMISERSAIAPCMV